MLAELDESTTEDFRLNDAILIYRAENKESSFQSRTIAMSHPIHQHEQTPMLGAGVPVTAAFLQTLLEQTDNSPLQYVGPEIVAIGRAAMAWSEASQPRTCYFATQDPAIQKLDGKAIPMPTLIFIARSRSLSVFALASNERPSAKTPLYHAPLYNIYDGGNMCIGSTRLPEEIRSEDTSSWSNAFFASNFTHVSGSAGRWAHRGSYAELLTDAITCRQFKSEWLAPAKKTLGEALCGK